MSDVGFVIEVGEVSDLEARVIVRYAEGDVRLRGWLRGPYCEKAHTLPADYPLIELASSSTGNGVGAIAGGGAAAEAIVTDPCSWSPELPHLYRVEVEAVQGGEVVAAYQGEVGLRRTRPLKNWDHIK